MALDEKQRNHALTVLTRLGQREPKAAEWLAKVVAADPGDLTAALKVAIDIGEPMGQVLGSTLAANPPPLEQLQALQGRLPPHAMALHPLPLTLARLVVEALPEEGAAGGVETLTRVEALTKYADRLAEAGQAEHGLDYAAEAVRLATKSRIAKHGFHAAVEALRVLSLCQVQAGRPKAATATAKRTARIVRRKAGRSSIDFAEALATLATRLPPDEGEAITIASQAIEQLRTIVASASQSPLYQLRQTLPQHPHDAPMMIHLGSPKDFGRNSKNLHYMKRDESGDWSDPTPVVFVDPSIPDPVRARMSLAGALYNRASRYFIAERLREALADAFEAIALLREITAGPIDDPAMMLGLALRVAATCLFDLNETDKAIPVAREAVSRLWPFAMAEGTDYWYELIAVEVRLLDAEQHEMTIGESAERLRAIIALLKRRNLQDRAGLAAVLANDIERLADFCCDRGWFSSELWACVTDCCRLASQDRPDAIPQLARALTNQATALHRDGQVAAALPVATEALELSLRWAEQTNDRTYPVAALHGLARRLAGLDRFHEAVDAAHQAIQRALPVTGSLTIPPLTFLGFIYTYSRYAMKAGIHKLSYEAEVFPAVSMALAELPEEADPQNLEIIAKAAFSVMSAAARRGDVSAAADLYRQFSALTKRHAGDDSLITCQVMIAWNLIMCYVDHAAFDLALSVYRDIARLASETRAPALTRVEHGKCATELIQAYLERDDLRMAQEIIGDASHSLHSPEYLAAREKDLGQAPQDFLDQLEQLLAVTPGD